jgi:anaerobic selenocysteine-containing dehydrogenase
LYEISHDNPLWISTPDARGFGIATGDLVKVRTRIGYFVTRAWVTEGIRPGILGMSHHLGRWRLHEEMGLRNAAALVTLDRPADGQYRIRQVHGTQPFESNDPDSTRVWWTEVGVHQNLTFPVQPDPVSGQHCWHQKVRVSRPGPDERYGDIVVDTERAHQVYQEWLRLARPAPGPGGLRRPLWLPRAFRPAPSAYRIP